MTDPKTAAQPDQGKAPWFRLLLLIQVLAAGFFGVVPYLFPSVAARATHYGVAEAFMWRLAGAAPFGYAVAAASALMKPAWYRFRIPAAASYTFNGAAVL